MLETNLRGLPVPPEPLFRVIKIIITREHRAVHFERGLGWRRCCHVVSFTFTLSPEQIRCGRLSLPQVVGEGNFENSGAGGCVLWNHAPEIRQIGQSARNDSRGPDQAGDVSAVASRLEVGFAGGSKPGSQPAASSSFGENEMA